MQIQMLAEKFHRFVLDCELKQPSIAQCSDIVSKQVNENSDSMDEHSLSNGTHEVSPDKGHTLPILKKILDLGAKIQDLKKQHITLCDEVKLTSESFPGNDILKSVQLLGAEYELLKRKYSEESSERRRLYNEVIELKGNIRVFCRCRPLNENEIANGSVSVVNFESSSDNELQVICADSSKKQFKFDHVFGPEDNQETVFQQTKPIVTSVLDGYNVCIFAYGQTGTGKTFTMEGTPEHRGVNYRTLEELFRITEERHGTMKYELSVSMLEVYNEKIRDLLVENSTQPTKKLEIKQAAEGTQEVPGLVEARVYGTEDVWEMLKTGNRVRSVGSTCANELSSRSHCLLRVTVMGENLINGQRTKSHLWLVDLAGSERVGKTEAEGERLKESQFINKSLSALGDVISALASKSSHIPYRQNSKLTHILQSSLGGDCKTLMFVQVSPSSADLGETLCSLNFATRVRGIESGPARKQVDHTELFKYKQMAEKLKQDEKETKKLQDSLQIMQLRLAAREHHCRSLQEKVDQCVARLQELQYTVTGGTKVVSGVTLSPRSTRGYLRTSLRCKQESLRIKNGASRRSPVGKFPANTGEWKRMSLPAMLVGETVGEILQASQFAREIVSAVGKKTDPEDPKTPMSQRSNKKVELENTQLRARRKKEKQTKAQNDGSPSLQRARSRINFKVSPPKVREFDKERNRYMANRVSPRNRPWTRKTVLFPNPLFLSTHSSSQQQFCKTRSPIITRNRGTTSHKFLIKSPSSPSGPQQFSKTRSPVITRNRGGTPHKFLIKSPSSASKFQVQIKKSPPTVSISPTKPARLSRSPPKRSTSTASKFRRSFSPSRIASRLVSLSPLRTRKTVQKNDGFVSGLKQRPLSSVQYPA
ncbi:hypothetical protein JHK82_057264 [Glycine max]|nr:hypothetical protein JHK86_057086 [Glycine max]KAG4911249.1 hypothetical protein JHK87_057365 [Glycine soja]KAG4919834.1 hypothetical protein JHK85_058115 [Glycine max]KAG5075916.1 hypothetical protein JHK84_057147 [Glycine max]KAG5078569.1 hypothetical protein JHK82_057264 [Glycine max]